MDFDPNVSGEKITPMAKKTTAVVIRVALPIDNGGGWMEWGEEEEAKWDAFVCLFVYSFNVPNQISALVGLDWLNDVRFLEHYISHLIQPPHINYGCLKKKTEKPDRTKLRW